MLPRSRSFDETFAFLREGYEFIGNRCSQLDACGFQTRIMLKPVVCLHGAAAAEQFYECACRQSQFAFFRSCRQKQQQRRAALRFRLDRRLHRGHHIIELCR